MLEREGQGPRDTKTNPYALKELVEIRRNILHIPQQQIANQMGISRNDLSTIESGRLLPNGDWSEFSARYVAAAKAVMAARIASI